MCFFCKLNRNGCSLRPKWQKSGPKVTQSHPRILKVSPKLSTSAPKAAPDWLYGCIIFSRFGGKYVFFVNGPKLHIFKLVPNYAKLPKSGRKVSPEWPKNRPCVRTPNGVKSLKFIVKMCTFCKLNNVGCSLRLKWPKSGPKMTQSHPHILKVSPKLPTSASRAGPKLTL